MRTEFPVLKRLFILLSLLPLALLGENSLANFENCALGALDGQEGFVCSSNVLAVTVLPVSQTNDILVSTWHSYGKQAALLPEGGRLENYFELKEGTEQRIAFDFYPTLPSSFGNKAATLYLGGVQVIRLLEKGLNDLKIEIYGSRFGQAPAWQEIPGVQPIKHRKWQHLEILVGGGCLLKVKTPYKDAELSGFRLAGPVVAGKNKYAFKSGLQNLALDNIRFTSCILGRRTVIGSLEPCDLKKPYATGEFGSCKKGGFEMSFLISRPKDETAGEVRLTSGESTLLKMTLEKNGAILDGSGRTIGSLPQKTGQTSFSIGLLESGRLVKAGLLDSELTFSNVWLCKEGLPKNLSLSFAGTSGNTNAATRLEGLFVQDSLPIAYGSVPCIDVLFVAYTGDGSLTPLQDYTNIYYPADKEFFYRNSNGNFLLLYDALYRKITAPAGDFFNSYENEFGEKECGGRIMGRDLRKVAGVFNEEYDLFHFACGNGWSHWNGNWGGGSSGYTGMGQIMCSQVGNYGSGTTFLNIHEIMHSVDQMYSYSGYKDYPSSHADGAAYDWCMGGDTYSWCGNAMRPFKDYDKMKSPWNGAYIYRDSDLDRLADEDWLLPADEARMQSDPGNADSDGDGLDDMGEYLVGLYYPSDPGNKDTDGDGLDDGMDPIPLSNYKREIQRLVKEPAFDGIISEGEWNYWGDTIIDTQDKDFKVKAYAGWREDGLYFAFKSNKKCGFMLEVDGSAMNSAWHGGDYFKFKIPNQYMNRMYAADPKDKNPQDWSCGAVPSGSRVMKKLNDEGGFTLEAKIPCNLKKITGYTCWKGEAVTNCFPCAPGQKLAFLFSFDGIGLDKTDIDRYRVEPYASSFECYDWNWFELVESETPFSLISAEPENGELHLGEDENIRLEYVNYGPQGTADISVEALGALSYSSQASAAISGNGGMTSLTQALAVPEDPSSIGQTDFRIVTKLNGVSLTNVYSWNVVPEPALALGLLLGLSLLAKRNCSR